MEDKLIMNNVLTLTKNMSDLLLHGTVESATKNVHATFKETLNECLDIQNQIYMSMQSQGWYQTDPVEEDKIIRVRNKFNNI